MNLNGKVQLALLAILLAVGAWACSNAVSQKVARASDDAGKAGQMPDLWRSLTTGKEYFVRMDKSHFYAQWVNLPPVSEQHGAYIHTACELKGSKWDGTSDIYMPCVVGNGKDEKVANNCHLNLKIEIDSVSNNRIIGRAQTLKKFDCGACRVVEAGWANFEWVPAK